MEVDVSTFVEIAAAVAEVGPQPEDDELLGGELLAPPSLETSSVGLAEAAEVNVALEVLVGSDSSAMQALGASSAEGAASSSSSLGIASDTVGAASSGAVASSSAAAVAPPAAEQAAEDEMANITWTRPGPGAAEGVVMRGGTPIGKLTPVRGRSSMGIRCDMHFGCRIIVPGKCSDRECAAWLARGTPLPPMSVAGEHAKASQEHKAKRRPRPGV